MSVFCEKSLYSNILGCVVVTTFVVILKIITFVNALFYNISYGLRCCNYVVIILISVVITTHLARRGMLQLQHLL